MNPICNLKCDAFCDAGDEENCPRYKEYRDELLKHCIAVYEQKIRAEAIDEFKQKSFDIIGEIIHDSNLEINQQLTIYAQIMARIDRLEEQLKEQKNE